MNIAIMTNFHDFYEGYSLSGIVRDQVLMLSRYGHDVHLFVSEKFSPEFHGNPPQQATLHKTVPAAHLKDYTSAKDLSKEHIEWIRKYADQLTCELQGFDVIVSHDWIFTGWNLLCASTIAEVTRRLPKLNWLHWIHSIPSGRRDWWKLGEMYLIEKNKIGELRGQLSKLQKQIEEIGAAKIKLDFEVTDPNDALRNIRAAILEIEGAGLLINVEPILLEKLEAASKDGGTIKREEKIKNQINSILNSGLLCVNHMVDGTVDPAFLDQIFEKKYPEYASNDLSLLHSSNNHPGFSELKTISRLTYRIAIIQATYILSCPDFEIKTYLQLMKKVFHTKEESQEALNSIFSIFNQMVDCFERHLQMITIPFYKPTFNIRDFQFVRICYEYAIKVIDEQLNELYPEEE